MKTLRCKNKLLSKVINYTYDSIKFNRINSFNMSLVICIVYNLETSNIMTSKNKNK